LRARLLTISTVLNIVANIVVLPLVGVAGAAWINLATEALLMCWYGYGAWRASVHGNV
jgi:O-antigen/teichoic acid export membrane protein